MNKSTDRKVWFKENSDICWSSVKGGYSSYGKGKLWRIYHNDLYSIDVETADVNYVTRIEVSKDKRQTFNKAVYNEGKIYLLPTNADYIAEYALITGEKKYIKYPNSVDNTLIHNVYSIYNNILYAFPVYGELILRFDLESGKTDYIECSDNTEFNSERCFGKNYTVYNKKIIIPCRLCNKVLIFDTETEEIVWKTFKEIKANFIAVTIEDSELYLLDSEKILYKIDAAMQGKLQKVYEFQDNYTSIKIIGKNKLFLIPQNREKISILELSSMKQTYLEYPEGFLIRSEKEAPIFNDIIETKDMIYIISWYSNMLLMIDKKTGELKGKKWKVSSDVYDHLQSELMRQIQAQTVVYEKENMLEMFLECVKENR